jgi:hypothetical protein
MKLDPLSDYGDLIPLEEFLLCVKNNCFIPYDGDGYWATKEGMLQGSNVWTLEPPEWATHVMWFNR